MNDNKSKAPIYIVLLVAIILVAAGSFYFGITKETPAPTPEKTPAIIPTEITTTPTPEKTPAIIPTEITTTPTPEKTPAVVTAPAKVETVKCELCHRSAQEIRAHVNGGRVCVNCHGSNVHNIHIGPGTVDLNCETCHSFPPIVPTVTLGEGPGHYSVCENCHAAPPDSLKPSNGDLIVVHLSRAKYCTNCHGTDIGTIHMSALANASR